MALKTRGKLIALGIATFAASAALAFGTVAAASNSGGDQPVLRITQDQNAGVQQTQQTPRAPGDARDCPFGHGSNGNGSNGSNGSGSSNNGGTVNPGDV